MLHTQFQTSGLSGSEEDFFYIFLCISNGSNLRPSGQGPSWTPGRSFEQTW